MSAIRDALVEAAAGAQMEERTAVVIHIEKRLLSDDAKANLGPGTATAYRKREELVREILLEIKASEHIDGPDWEDRF